ncbi:MAG: class I SAM-dependent methyltransferase [Actinomycetota bacterium]
MTEPYPRQQAQIFGDDAASYDRFRPAYPRELLEDVVERSGPEVPVLEIGAGTGKATKALTVLGRRVHAIEPDRRMAAVLSVNCGDSPVDVEHATLEMARLPAQSYHLAVAAQSWHWVDPHIGYDIVADALMPDGTLALLWHHPRSEQGMFGAALEQLYRELAPGLEPMIPGNKSRRFDPLAEPESATTRFDEWERIEHRWRRTLDAANLIGWLCSGSDHRMLPIEHRSELMSGVAALVAEFGGTVTIGMSTVAHLGRRI